MHRLSVEGPSVQLLHAFSDRLHFRAVEVSAHLHTAEEVPLEDITGAVLWEDSMGVEVDFVEAEVREVTAKSYSLFLYSGDPGG